jgi:hypothetical protein
MGGVEFCPSAPLVIKVPARGGSQASWSSKWTAGEMAHSHLTTHNQRPAPLITHIASTPRFELESNHEFGTVMR